MASPPPESAAAARRRAALRFIVCLGLVSLFADMTYEGARSIIGPYLQVLGASGFEMGLVIGLGEMCAASLRYLSGRLADRTRAYWLLTIVGYCINLLAVPALALASSWQAAALLVIAERTGKAVRVPSRDVLLSGATAEVGHGWGFALHNAMDQTGAVIGPLWVALAVARTHVISRAFMPLAIPAVAALTALFVARAFQPPAAAPAPASASRQLPAVFWMYVAAAGLLAFGYLDFPFFAYYWVRHALFSNAWIPVLYAAAMAGEGLTGLLFGRLFDRWGVAILAAATLVSLWSLPLGFLGGPGLALGALACWAVGTGAQSVCMKSGIAQVVSMDRRGTAFGSFYAVFGVLWFAGSALLGWLLDHHLLVMVAVGMAAQAAAAVLFFILRRGNAPAG